MNTQEIRVPDLGSFADVPVIDVLVKPGDLVEVDTPLLTLETDKASMDVPSPVAGTVTEVLVGKGSRVSRGTAIVRLAASPAEAAVIPALASAPAPTEPRKLTGPVEGNAANGGPL